jgi:hypothetical protein
MTAAEAAFETAFLQNGKKANVEQTFQLNDTKFSGSEDSYSSLLRYDVVQPGNRVAIVSNMPPRSFLATRLRGVMARKTTIPWRVWKCDNLSC